MTLQYQSGLLKKVETAFSDNNKRFGKLNDYIMELQGSGNTHINAVVNDLVFLRRELIDTAPNEHAIQRRLASLYQKTEKIAEKQGAYTSVLRRLQKTIVQAAR